MTNTLFLILVVAGLGLAVWYVAKRPAAATFQNARPMAFPSTLPMQSPFDPTLSVFN